MSVSKKHKAQCRVDLLDRGDFSPVEVGRFIDYASEIYGDCPYCTEGPVYSCVMKKITLSGERRFIGAIFTYGISAMVGNDNKFYWCYECTRSGSEWF